MEIAIALIAATVGGVIGWLWHDNRRLRLARTSIITMGDALADRLDREQARTLQAKTERDRALADCEEARAELADARRALLVQVAKREGADLADLM